jgi:pimeloyl-ACP methyl ester carboxylesterase
LAALVVCLAAIFLATRPSTASEFKSGECWFKIPADRDMTCGHLTVPENREHPGGQKIVLPVVILEPDRERHEPVVFLSGGPGQRSGLKTDDDIEDWWRFHGREPWLRGRRLVLVDQRGAGLSDPALDCSEFFTDANWKHTTAKPDEKPDFDAASELDVRACRTALMARGIDLRSYNTRENAEDIIDLRLALKIDRWVLYGVSYGTDLGLTIIERHPEGVAAAVLDSVLPPHFDYLAHDAENLDRDLRKLDQDCASQPACSGRQNWIMRHTETIVRQLNAQPVLLRYRKPGEAADTYTRFSGNDFLELLFDQFYNRETIEFLPLLIERAYDQDYRSVIEALGDDEDKGDVLDGMNFSVICSEAGSGARASGTPSLFADWATSSYDWICPLWLPDRPEPPAATTAAEANVPVLMLSGEYDPVTPASWAEDLAKEMPGSHAVLFRGVGHDVIDTDTCGSKVVADFLRNPGGKIVTPCLAELEAPQFVPPSHEDEAPEDLDMAANGLSRR